MKTIENNTSTTHRCKKTFCETPKLDCEKCKWWRVSNISKRPILNIILSNTDDSIIVNGKELQITNTNTEIILKTVLEHIGYHINIVITNKL